MEAQTDITTYLEQGKQALAQGQGRESAIAYAHAAQIEPDNPLVHLGLAEANLALASYGVATMASHKVQELTANSGPMASVAQAILHILDRRYDQALQSVDSALKDDPGNGYIHAMRAYLLRATHQDYDAGLARSRASRLSFGGTFENCFPPIEPVYASGYKERPTDFVSSETSTQQQMQQPRAEQREQIPTWTRPNNMQRRMIRTRFWLNQNPRFVTTILIALNVLAYLILAFMSGNLANIDLEPLITMGAQIGFFVAQGQVWRIFTAMFLHFSIIHVAVNMLSLFFIGTAVELFYGKWRYLLIYLVSGIVGGIVTFYLIPQNVPAAGASGAIFGIFGALGAFYVVNRRALGSFGMNAIGNWVFWLLLNLYFSFSIPGIGIADHIGGLIAGFILGMLLLPPLRRVGRSG